MKCLNVAKTLLWAVIPIILLLPALSEEIPYNVNHYPFESVYAYKVNNIYNESLTFFIEGSMVYSDAKLCDLKGTNCSITRKMEPEDSAQLVIKTLIYEKSNTTQENITLNVAHEKIPFNMYYLYSDATEDYLLKSSLWVSQKVGKPVDKVEGFLKIVIILLALYAVGKLAKLI